MSLKELEVIKMPVVVVVDDGTEWDYIEVYERESVEDLIRKKIEELDKEYNGLIAWECMIRPEIVKLIFKRSVCPKCGELE